MNTRVVFGCCVALVVASLVAVGCGGSQTSGGGGSSGTAGSSGGGAGVSGSGGSAGVSGSGGSAGVSGSGGSAGVSGSGGSAGVDAGSGGSAGVAGSGGSAGVDAGSGGSAGVAASGGAAGGGAAGADAGVDPACATIPTTSTLTAHLRITADNECEVFVNGTSVGTTSSWSSAVTIDVSLFVHPGVKNVIAVRGTNTSSQSGNDRGIIGELTVDSDGGAVALVQTDAAWRVSPTEEVGWTAPAFDDTAWIAATEIAANGDPPWGAILPSSTAKWIWSALVPVNTSDKPNLETTYARRDFYFSIAGSVVDAPQCP